MATAAPALISLEKYLNTVYRPDRDFVDGEIERRNVGEFDHNRIQGLLNTWLTIHEAEWNIISVPEQRIRVTESRVRVADVCALRAETPVEQVTETPPLLCVEVLSPKDRLSRTILVMEDYLQMGVQHLWVIDPRYRVAYTYNASGLLKLVGDEFTIPGTPIYVDVPSLFARLSGKPS
jgi:Uma2 family endonuclease